MDQDKEIKNRKKWQLKETVFHYFLSKTGAGKRLKKVMTKEEWDNGSQKRQGGEKNIAKN